MENVEMDESELDVTENDLFLAEHYEELFYLAPKELAIAINAMNEDELLQFNQTFANGYGMNVDLIRDKLDELSKYLIVNPAIFQEAYLRTTLIDKKHFHDMYAVLKKMFADKDKCPSMMKSYTFLLGEASTV
jgi:hypothetical protein